MSLESPVILSIVMPCLNEARTVGTCIGKASHFLQRAGISGEIIIADNGSTDGSQEIARRLGARVISVAERGYGSALRAGIAAARGDYVIMGDSDDSYDYLALDPFVAKLMQGYDLVLGNRFAGGIKKRAMPPLHRYFGNPALTSLGRLLYGSPSRDFYCGLRGFRREAVLSLDLSAPGMEFALEMIVKAAIRKLKITEVPTTLSPDGRDRPPHLRSWRDGWRSLRFFLLLSPRAVFLYPGLALFALSGLLFISLLFGDVQIGGLVLRERALIISSFGTLVGFQSVLLWVFGEMIAVERGLLPRNPTLERAVRALKLERGLVSGGALIAAGIAGNIYATYRWSSLGFGTIAERSLVGVVCGSSAMIAFGFQCISGCFFAYLLQEARRQASMPGHVPELAVKNPEAKERVEASR